MKPRSVEAVARAVRKQEESHASRVLDLWIDSVPAKYRGFDMEDANRGWSGSLDQPGIIAVQRYLKNPEKGFLLLHGSNGTGKTSLAVTIATELVRTRRIGSRLVNSVSLLQAFSFPQDSDPLRINSEVPILVIDDLGSVNEGITPHQKKLLWALIENRWSDNRITILTTNMAIQTQNNGIGLADWVGPSGWDRITDNLTRIALEGASLRDD